MMPASGLLAYPYPRQACGLRGLQRGQALAELLVAALALCMLWAAAAWLGRLQDMALQADHAARHLAFLGARQADADWPLAARNAYFDGQGHRWTDRRGQSLLPTGGQAITAQVLRLAPVVDAAQPGNGHARGAELRSDWQLADAGVMQAQVAVRPRNTSSQAAGPAWSDALRGLDGAYPTIRRHAHILEGAGHADGDGQAWQRIAQADLPWARAAAVSYRSSNHVEGRMRRVDQAWGRQGPGDDWLHRWQAWLPDWHVSNQRGRP